MSTKTISDPDLAPPRPASLVESLRAFGYDLSTALADLADNSLFAKAKNIKIHFYWGAAESAIALADDGIGMNAETLVDAMCFGSTNPRAIRHQNDFGRFGLGLKTASFSQCRRLTVITHQKRGQSTVRCWDIDYVAETNEWRLLRDATSLAKTIYNQISLGNRGTVVVWEKLDRITVDHQTLNESAEDLFLHQAEQVRNHFASVFHRLMEDRNGVKFFLNEKLIKPWDPFLTDQQATKKLPPEELILKGKTILVQPFVLPHLSKLNTDTHAKGAGLRGWNAHQGFYIYRNRRLIVAGDWLGIKSWRQEEHFKLARIKVDLPNSLDHEWELDVTKSRARPPQSLRDDFYRIGEYTRNRAKQIYAYRGAKLIPVAGQERVFLWQQISHHNRVSYQLNREHPLVQRVRATSSDIPKLSALFRLIEETMPIPLITITDHEKPDLTIGPFETTKDRETLEVMRQVLGALLHSGFSINDALKRLGAMEPFPRFPQLLQIIIEESETV